MFVKRGSLAKTLPATMPTSGLELALNLNFIEEVRGVPTAKVEVAIFAAVQRHGTVRNRIVGGVPGTAAHSTRAGAQIPENVGAVKGDLLLILLVCDQHWRIIRGQGRIKDEHASPVGIEDGSTALLRRPGISPVRLEIGISMRATIAVHAGDCCALEAQGRDMHRQSEFRQSNGAAARRIVGHLQLAVADGNC